MSEVITRPHYDAGERRFIFERVQDCEDIVEHNKALKSIEQKSDWGRHTHSVPNIFIEKWYHEFLDRGAPLVPLSHPEFKAFCTRKLSSTEFSAFRVDK